MAKQRKLSPTPAKSCKAVHGLARLQIPSLLPGEDATGYDRLHAELSAALQPVGAIEAIWVHDLVYLTWNIFRLRRLHDGLIKATCHEGLERLLTTLTGYDKAHELATRWAIGVPDAIKSVDQLLASANLTVEAIVANTLSLKIDEIERIDRMIMTAEARRNDIYREIDRHRTALASAAQRAVQDIEDAEFKVVESETVQLQNLAPL